MATILGANTLSSGFDVANSCMFNDNDSAYMHITRGSAGNQRTFTISMWIKRVALGGGSSTVYFFSSGPDNNNSFSMHFTSTDQLEVWEYKSSAYQFRLKPQYKFRDTSAWYHVVVAVDTTQGTDSNRVKFYINGTQYTDLDTTNWPSQNYDTYVNDDAKHWLGKYTDQSAYYDGYLAEVVVLDGTAASPTSFGEFDEDSPQIWKPIDVSGLTFGTNGFYLDFEDSSNLGNDKNGGTDWTEVNLAATDQMTDTCTNNFCTLSVTLNTAIEYSEGALKGVKASGDGNQRQWGSTFAVNSGKWYWECKSNLNSTNHWYIGICDAESIPHSMTNFPGDTTKSYGIRGSDGYKLYNASASSYGSAIGNGDVVMIALDLDNSKIWFGENGTWFNSGDPAAGSNEAFDITDGDFYMPTFTSTGGGGEGWFCNFGSPAYSISSGNADGNGYGNFEYSVPSGFLSLCTKNLGGNS